MPSQRRTGRYIFPCQHPAVQIRSGDISGVFIISIRRGDVPLASWGVGACGGGGWAPQKSSFHSKMISLGAFCAVFNTQKTRKLWGDILQFNREITQLTKTVQKLSKTSRSHQRGWSVAPWPPEYATWRH